LDCFQFLGIPPKGEPDKIVKGQAKTLVSNF